MQKHLVAIQNEVIAQAVQKKLITRSPRFLKNTTEIIAFFWIVLSCGLFFYSGGALFLFLGIPAGIIGMILGSFMGQRTKVGMTAWRYLQGYKKYLTVAEKDRIQFFNDPKKYQELFESVLPYAIVLGVEKEWSKQFEGLITQSPDWYTGNMHTGFAMSSFSDSIASFNQSATTVVSSGGGSSGGGFGGGGGGSW